MKAFKYILIILLIFIIGFSIYVAVQPNSFEVSKTRKINAPMEVVFKQVIDFKTWESWLSWVETNPDLKISLSEQTKGTNSTLFWEDDHGVGTIKTSNITPYTHIQQELQTSDFPPSLINWTLKTVDNGSTEVTCSVSGKDLSFNFKMRSVLKGHMEKQIETHNERSLEKLDSVIVTDMKKYSIEINGITEHGGGYYIYNSASCKISALQSKIKEMLPKLMQYAQDNKVTISGFPFIYYHKFDEANDAVMFSCCILTTTRVITTQNDILTGQLKPFKTLKTTLKGDYKNLQEAWNMSIKYIKNSLNEVDDNGPMIEMYLVSPFNSPNPAKWITEIYIALKEVI